MKVLTHNPNSGGNRLAPSSHIVPQIRREMANLNLADEGGGDERKAGIVVGEYVRNTHACTVRARLARRGVASSPHMSRIFPSKNANMPAV